MVTTNQKPTKIYIQKRRKNPDKTIKKNCKPQGKRLRRKKGTNNYKINQKTINKIAVSTHLPIITLNVNSLNVPIRRQRVAEWIKSHDPSVCCSHETHCKSKDIQTESEGLKKRYSMQLVMKRKLG